MASKKIASILERIEEQLRQTFASSAALTARLSNTESTSSVKHRDRSDGNSMGRPLVYNIIQSGTGSTGERDKTFRSKQYRGRLYGMYQYPVQREIKEVGHLLPPAGQLKQDRPMSTTTPINSLDGGGKQLYTGQSAQSYGRPIQSFGGYSGHQGRTYQGGLTQMHGNGTYQQYLDALTLDTLVRSSSRILLDRYDDEKEKDLNKWLECWKGIAQELFPAKYGFRVTTESVTLLPGDALFHPAFKWPVNYLAIHKGAQCQEFGIIYAHDPYLYVNDPERATQVMDVTRELGNVLQHVGRAGKRTYWIHTFGEEFICAANHHLLVPRKFQDHSLSVLYQDSIGIDILRKVALKIANRRSEKLFQSVPDENSNKFIMVPLN